MENGKPATRPSRHARIGIGAELDAPRYPVTEGELHMAVARVGYVGLVRVESGRLNVAAAVDASALRASTPEHVVAGILCDAGLPPLPRTVAHGWRGTPSLTRSGEAGALRLLRVGDAAGYVEPFTGEGIGWALADGRAAAEIALRVLDGDPAEALVQWRRSRAATRSAGERLCRALAWGLRRPRLVGLTVAALGAAPQLATPLVRRAGRPRARLTTAHPHEGSA
jgi:flavin-dependent dehydrogenase